MSAAPPRILLLNPEDDVYVACANLEPGSEIAIEGRHIIVGTRIPLGHKLARRDIPAGASVLKYGAPIGIATAAIAAGAHVHVHNLRSDYLPTYTLDGANPYVKDVR